MLNYQKTHLPQTLNEHFEQTYRENAEWLYNTARALLSNYEDVFGPEDQNDAATILPHEAYIQATSTFHCFGPHYPSFHKWFVGIMRHILRRKRREQHSQYYQAVQCRPFSSFEQQNEGLDKLEFFVALSHHTPEETLARQDQLKFLLSCLDERERTLLSLRYVEELPQKQIEEILHLPPRSCSLYLSRIITRLQKMEKNTSGD